MLLARISQTLSLSLSLSSSAPIYRFRQIFQTTSCVRKELLSIHFCLSANTGPSIWRGSLFHQQQTACLVRFTWMALEMGGKKSANERFPINNTSVELITTYLLIFSHPSTRTGYDTRSILSEVWIQSFSSPRPIAIQKLKSQSSQLVTQNWRGDSWIPKSIWTRVAVSISYDSSHYITKTKQHIWGWERSGNKIRDVFVGLIWALASQRLFVGKLVEYEIHFA